MQSEDVIAGQALLSGKTGDSAISVIPPYPITQGAHHQVAFQVFASGGDPCAAAPRIGPKVAFDLVGPAFLHVSVRQTPIAGPFAREEKIKLVHRHGSLRGKFARIQSRGGTYRHQSPIHAHPQRSGFLRHDHSTDAETVGAHAPDVNPAVPMATQLAVRSVEPYCAVSVLTSCHQAPFTAAPPDVQTFDLAIFNQNHPGGLGSDPEVALAVLKEKDNSATVQPWRIALVKHGESNAIKTHQAI